MTTDREVMQLALEALEYEAQRGNDNAYEKERTALRTALSRKALDELAEIDRELGLDYMQPEIIKTEIGKDKLDEPVAWAEKSVIDWFSSDERGEKAKAVTALTKKKGKFATIPLYIHPPVAASDTSQQRVDETQEQRHEPVIDKSAAKRIATQLGWEPKREWRGLTDEDIDEIHSEIKVKGMGSYKTEDIYRAIEAKLKEKNS